MFSHINCSLRFDVNNNDVLHIIIGGTQHPIIKKLALVAPVRRSDIIRPIITILIQTDTAKHAIDS